jgi:hypothetical protein
MYDGRRSERQTAKRPNGIGVFSFRSVQIGLSQKKNDLSLIQTYSDFGLISV